MDSIITSRLQAHCCCLDVPVHFIECGGVEIPWIDPVHMMTWLATHDKLHLVHHDVDLLQFWHRFARTQPTHPVFQQGLPLSNMIPFLAHGDEGRTKKKKALMVWSFKGVAGSGSRFFKDRPPEEQRARMGLNLDNSLKSRFLHAVMPNRWYKDNNDCWTDLAAHIGRSYLKLRTEGFRGDDGKVWYA